MNAVYIIIRITWLLFGLAAGYDIARSNHASDYEFSLLIFIPFFLAIVVGELFVVMQSKSKKTN